MKGLSDRQSALVFQDSHDRKDCFPAPCCGRRTEQIINLGKIADRPHMATVRSKHEPAFRRDNTHEPLPIIRKCDWQGSLQVSCSRQNAHESDDIPSRRLDAKWVLRLQANEISTLAECDLHLEWQLAKKFGPEL